MRVGFEHSAEVQSASALVLSKLYPFGADVGRVHVVATHPLKETALEEVEHQKVVMEVDEYPYAQETPCKTQCKINLFEF